MDDMENIVLITFSDVLQDCGKVLGYSSLMFILLPGSQTFILKKKKKVFYCNGLWKKQQV